MPKLFDKKETKWARKTLPEIYEYAYENGLVDGIFHKSKYGIENTKGYLQVLPRLIVRNTDIFRDNIINDYMETYIEYGKYSTEEDFWLDCIPVYQRGYLDGFRGALIRRYTK